MKSQTRTKRNPDLEAHSITGLAPSVFKGTLDKISSPSWDLTSALVFLGIDLAPGEPFPEDLFGVIRTAEQNATAYRAAVA